jgi:DNA-binding transcriptional LysR family regulator
MAQDDLNVLSAFLAVAEERSFTKAAKRLNFSQSALNHAVRGLEEQIGVRLLARTTRSVAPTDAGEELLRSLRPALTDSRAALGKISGQRDKPAGRVRLVVSPLAAGSVLGPKLGEFARNYPDVVLDITTDESRVDLVAGGYDAGIHYGEFIEQDMGRRPRLAGSPAGDRWFIGVLRLASPPQVAARSAAAPLHQLPTRP